MQKKKEEINNEKCFESNFNELNEELSNNNRMTHNEDANALAEKIDNFASSRVKKKEEKNNNNSGSSGSNSNTSGGNINEIKYNDDKGNNPNSKNNII